jgi:hypothetical protein
MHEHADTPNAAAYERMLGAIDAACVAIAGFALLAGTRAFAFLAVVAWREPVLGGAGLVVLALVGWMRCCWRRHVITQTLTSAFDPTTVRFAVCASRFELQQEPGERKTMQTTNNVGTIGAGSADNTASTGSVSGARARNQPSFKALLDELTEYTKGSTAEQMQKAILAQLGVSEEDLKKMSPEEREKVMQKVREMLKKELEAQKQIEEMQKGNKIRVSV